MALKSFLFVSLLIAGLMTAPLAEAQLGGLGNIVGGIVGGIGGIIGGVVGIVGGIVGGIIPGIGSLIPGIGGILVQGKVFCSANGNMGVSGTSTPVFSNAQVQLQCGSGNVVATTLTKADGVFSLLMNPGQNILSSLQSKCNVVVNTPLSTCNASLPAGGILSSPLQQIGKTVDGVLGTVLNVAPTGFILQS